MPALTLFFDVDDTLYPPSTGIWDLIGRRIDIFIQTRLNLAPEKTATLRKRLFATYGTTLRGLVEEFGIDREEYLAFVHSVPVETILQPDPALRESLLHARENKIVFTNADKKYAQRVIHTLGLDGCFSQIIDIVDIWPACKPQTEAFTNALSLGGDLLSSQVILFDDTPANLVTASSLGFRTVLVGNKPISAGIHCRIEDIHDFGTVLPGEKN
jgi:putative hydrolase of the HAD superfamily